MVELSTQSDVWHMHFFQKAIAAASTNARPRRLSWLKPVLRNRMKKPVEQEIVDEKALYSWKFHVLSHKWCSSSNWWTYPKATRQAYLDEVSDQRGREHVVDPVVFIAEHVVEVSSAAVWRQDEHVAGVDARAEEGNQVLVPNLAHLHTNVTRCTLNYGQAEDKGIAQRNYSVIAIFLFCMNE